MNQKINLFSIGLLLAAATLFVSGCNTSRAGGNYIIEPNTSPASSGVKELKAKAKDLALTGTTTKLDPKARIKGKTAVVIRSASGSYTLENHGDRDGEYDLGDLNNYDLTKEEVAASPEEIETLVVISCDKGKKIGEYETKAGLKYDAFAQDCKVSASDYKTRTVFAEKTITSKELKEDIKITSATTEGVAYYPTAQTGEYVRSLRGK